MSGTVPPEKRLDGWKSIAAYFRRDRSTVMRWARDRNLPIHRMPGGKQGSVFAFEHELAAWSMQHPDDTDAPLPAPPPPVPPIDDAPRAPPPKARLPRAAISALIALVVLLCTGAWLWLWLSWPPRHSPAKHLELPRQAAVAADYVTARDAWGRRTARDIGRAIALYQQVIAREPDFAPAYTGLAEAWLVYREYGQVNDQKAYGEALVAAKHALRLDANIPDAYRAMAFIHYWWSNDAERSKAEFRRAIELDPRDAQSHFWFANMLSALGDDPAAQAEYDQARLLSPGSQLIAVEQACSHWQAGRDGQAARLLTDLAAHHPGDATIHNCLAWLHISHGDIKGYAREYAIVAHLRREPNLLTVSRALDAAISRDPRTAHRVLITEARREIATGGRRLRETPAFQASAMGDRAQLLALMQEAATLEEKWFSATITRRIGAKWRGDAEVESLLAKLTPAPAAQGG